MNRINLILIVLFFTFSHSHRLSAHGHIDAGTTNGGTELYLYNVYNLETILTPTYDDYVEYSESGASAARINALIDGGFEYIFEVTFTSLGIYSANPALESAPSYYSTLGANSGSYLQLQLVGLSGPGTFGFWESSNATTTASWTATVGHDFINDPLVIDLTSAVYFDPAHPGNATLQASIPGISSPYGHRHSRRYGVDEAGLYTLEWQVIDREGGYVASQSFFMNFHAMSAIPEPSTLGLLAAGGLVAYLGLRRRKEQP